MRHWSGVTTCKTRCIYFADIKNCQRAANYFISLGIKKDHGTCHLEKWEYWIIAVALHKIGAVLIPASLQHKRHNTANAADASNHLLKR